MMEPEVEFWAAFERTNVRPHDAKQRELAAHWLSRRGSFAVVDTLSAMADTVPAKAAAVTEHEAYGEPSAPARPSRHDGIYSDAEIFSLLQGHWNARDVVGIARLHGVLDSRHQLTQPGALRWDGAKELPFTIDHRASSVATITGLYDVSATALPFKVQAAFPACTGAVLVARRYHDTPAGQAAKAAVLEGRRTGMSLTYAANVDDNSYDGSHDRTLRTIKQASVSEFTDTDEPVQHATFALITQDDYLTPRGLYQWDL